MTKTIRGRTPQEPPPRLGGTVPIPASKSHAIRALLVATLADGTSRLRRPLLSRDTVSCRSAVEALGARVRDEGGDWIVTGVGGRPRTGEDTETVIDVGNSGTTLYLAMAVAALAGGAVRFDGDEQIRRRSAEPLLGALEDLGVLVTREGPDGCAPFTIRGPLKAGPVRISCPVSQYLSALLLAAPLANTGGNPDNNGAGGSVAPVTEITVTLLNEAPYAGITLDWLDRQGIRYQQDGWDRFVIPGGQRYRPFDAAIPADWSSATFFLAAAAITRSTIILKDLDVADSQGDKAVADMLVAMGCRVTTAEGGLRIEGRSLRGAVLDLNPTPDALPAMAAAACYAEGETRLVNVPQARMKETDRIAVMTAELKKMGADIEELPEGMVIRGNVGGNGGIAGLEPSLRGARLSGHDDHRVVMALAVAALGAVGESTIEGAEAVDVTFPGFFDRLEESIAAGVPGSGLA